MQASKNPASASQRGRPEKFAFIIGAMKSGTTSLFDILSQHPQVSPSKIKEPDFFIRDFNDSQLNDYLSLWPSNNTKNIIALESSVAYTKYPFITGTPERIHHSNIGQYRFIYMLRNPLNRIESQVRHSLFAGWGESLDDGLPQDAIDFSRYSMQLDQYRKFFPLDHILLVTLEEFKHSPHAVLSRICHFLDIDTNFKFIDIESTRNPGEFFNASPTILTITQNPLAQYLARNILSSNMKQRLKSIVIRLSKHSPKPRSIGRWQLTNEEKSLILEILTDDLIRLNSEFKVDITNHWNISPKAHRK